MCAVCGPQCVTAETKLDMLRERMAGNKDCGAELRRKEQDYLSLLSIQVSRDLSLANLMAGCLDSTLLYQSVPMTCIAQ